MRKILYLTLATILFFIKNSTSQNISFDNSFNANFHKYGNGVGPDAEVRTILPLPNGKFMLGGWFAFYNGAEAQRIVSINPDGSLDQSFNSGKGFNNVVQNIAIQPDNLILVGGDFTLYNNDTVSRLVRLLPNGQRDTTFNPIINNIVRNIAVLPNGKILISGWFTKVNNLDINFIARLEPNGEIDPTFQVNLVDNYINCMQLTDDGDIFIGGGFNFVDDIERHHIAKLNKDGTADLIFESIKGCNGDVTGMLVQSDGKVLIGGWFTQYDNTNRNKIARVLKDGRLDLTFEPGVGADRDVNSFALQNDGKILIGGFFTTYNGTTQNNIARLEENGTLDINFNIGTGFTTGILNYNVRISAFAINNAGEIYVGGDFIKYNNFNKSCLLRLTSTGAFDADFNPYNGTNNTVYKTKRLNDGSYLLCGNFTAYDNRMQRNYMTKLLPNGLPNDGFVVSFNGPVYDFVVEPSGFITAVGDFTTCNNTNAKGIARFNSYGVFDSSFSAWNGFNANAKIRTILHLDNNQYLVAGLFNQYNGVNRNNITLINFDGTIDSINFTPLAGPNGMVKTMVKQSDGKYVLGGDFTVYRGTPALRIARINPNGSYDFSYITTSGFNASVNQLVLDTAEKIIAVGAFTSYNLDAINRIVRINKNGRRDTSFHIGNGANAEIKSIALQSDSKILIGGDFTFFNGNYCKRFTRLNINGNKDITFNLDGANDAIYNILIEPNGRIITSGSFSQILDNNITGVARIISDRTLNIIKFNGILCAGSKIIVNYTTTGTFDSSNVFTAQLSNEYGNFTFATNIGSSKTLGNGNIICTIPVNATLGSGYRVRIICNSPNMLSDDNGSDLSIDNCPSMLITNQISKNICQGNNLNVDFETSGIFNLNNQFTLQLSDTSGSFNNPTNLATVNGVIGSTINTTIPLNLEPSANYLLRIVSSSPVTYSFNDGMVYEVKKAPSVSISLSGTTNFCFGDSTLINSTSSNDVATYTWLKNGNIYQVNNVLSFVYAKTAGNYTVKVTANNGCITESNQVAVTSFNYNLASIGSNKLGACLTNNQFTIFDNTKSNNIANRFWEYDSLTRTDSVFNLSFATDSIHRIKLVVKYNDGCVDTAVQNLTVHPQTNIKISINQNNQCLSSNNFELIDSSTNSSGQYFRLWDLGNSDTYTTAIVNKKYTTIGTQLVKFKTVTQNGCIDSTEEYISVNANPKAKFGYRAVVPCLENNFIQFYDSSTIQNGAINYVRWFFPGYLPSIANNPGINFPAEGLNNFTLVAVSTLGCTDTLNATVNILPNPPKPIIHFNNDRLFSDPGIWYQWFLNGVMLIDSHSISIAPKALGNYTVRLFNSNNCSSLSNPVTITTVGLNNTVKNHKINIYPNPTNGLLSIEYNLNATIQVSDINGRQLLNTNFEVSNPVLNINHLVSGVYFITITDNNIIFTQKIIKQ